MLARVAHDLGRGVKSHRLGIEQRRGEGRRMMAFDPGRDIDQQREAGGMAFGKAVFAEAFDLLEAGFGEIPVIAARRSCRSTNLSSKVADGADMAEGRHGAAQSIGFVGVNSAATMASRIACSWNRGTPSVFSTSFSSSGSCRRRGLGISRKLCPDCRDSACGA